MDNKPVRTYCDFVTTVDNKNVHKQYHDKEYGFPIETDNELFARLVLEINQAGLSWDTILKKKDSFFKAYEHFEIKKVAKYNEKEIADLMQDAGIIRNPHSWRKRPLAPVSTLPGWYHIT
jgi:DNA-3-methyladenine glycosylase I